MNNLIDLHLHSNFSPDSKQSIESYFQSAAVTSFVTTDHLDYWQNAKHQNVVLDYQGLKEEISKHAQAYLKEYYIGVEVGYHPSVEAETIGYLKNKQFDILILSFHQDGNQDYLYTNQDYIVDEEQYLDNIIRGLSVIENVTILGHLDYPFRNNQMSNQFLSNPKLKTILKLLIEKHIALEVNTRSVYQFKNLEFYRQLLSLYYEQGGRLISLGSDGHSFEYYRYHFADAQDLLSSIGEFEVINNNY